MTVPHHSEPAALDQRALSAARKVYNESLNIDIGALGATERIVRAYISASPAPAAGGLGAVRGQALEAAAEEFCRRVEAGEIRSKRSYAAFKAALASPAATSGRGAEVAAAIEACDWSAPSLGNSAILREAVSLLRSAPAATSAETQGGDGVRKAVSLFRAFAQGVASGEVARGLLTSKRAAEWVDECTKGFRDDIAALAPSTSAATRGEPVALTADDRRLLDKAIEASTEHLYGFGKPAPAVESAQVKP